MTIQEAIDFAIEKNSNVHVRCSFTNEEIKAEIKDSKGCGFFWNTGEMIGEVLRIVPPCYMDTLGVTGPVITIQSLDKIHQG